MIYRLLADLAVATHLLFILFALGGGLLWFWRRWALWLHAPAALWACLIEFYQWTCPLTTLENWLRAAGSEAGYDEGFIAHYLLPLIYPAGLTPALQLGAGLVVIGVNVTIYGFVVRAHCRNRRAGRT